MTIELRPSVNNRSRWHERSRKRAVPESLRKRVLSRDDYTCSCCGHRAKQWMHIHHLNDNLGDELTNLATVCPACHAVMHFGRSLMYGTIEIWRTDVEQVEIIRKTREGVRLGLSLESINQTFVLKKGRFVPSSLNWANNLVATMGELQHAELPKPLCAVFVNFNQWQVDA
jgi:hypothetical protein